MLREMLSTIVGNFALASTETFKEHPLAQFISREAPVTVRESLGSLAQVLTVEGSAGAGRWADVPWITVMDPRVTDSATRGYYLVYLFNWRAGRIFLSLNQGATQVGREYGGKRDEILSERASEFRKKLKTYPAGFDASPIALDGRTNLARSYEPGHSIGKMYDAANLPSEHELATDLRSAAEAYLHLFTLGGLETVAADDSEDQISSERPQATTVLEKRTYRAHRAIERRSSNSKRAKDHHGYVCQACGFDFVSKYGPLGARYIEAHHRVPLATLALGIPTKISIHMGFCVLCANCHRMIHRQDDPSDLDALRAVLAASAANE